jgi:hypothetical protein
VNFTVPLVNTFGAVAATTVDPNVGYLAGSLQAVVAAKTPFANLNAGGATDTVSTADTTIDLTTTATGSQT